MEGYMSTRSWTIYIVWGVFALTAVVQGKPLYDGQECEYNGQFLVNKDNECSYLRCGYGHEPWYDSQGTIRFVPLLHQCPYGTSTNIYNFDEHNPCSYISDKCGAPLPIYEISRYYTDDADSDEPEEKHRIRTYGSPDVDHE